MEIQWRNYELNIMDGGLKMKRIKERIKTNWYRTVSLLLSAVGKNKSALFYMDMLVKQGHDVGEKDWWTLGYLCTRDNQ